MRSAFLALLVLRMSQCDNTLLQPYLMDAPLTLDLDNQVFVKCRVTGAHPFHRNIHGYTEIALDVKVGLTDGGGKEDMRAGKRQRSYDRSKSCALWNDVGRKWCGNGLR
jgi:hypothetical protein